MLKQCLMPRGQENRRASHERREKGKQKGENCIDSRYYRDSFKVSDLIGQSYKTNL